MAQHLILRGSTYYARLAIPTELRHKLGKREFTQSLRTGNKADATMAMHELIPDWKRLIAAAGGDAGELESLAISLRQEDKGQLNPQTGLYDIDYYVEEMTESLKPSEAKVFRELYDGRRGIPFTYFASQWINQTYTNAGTKNDAYRALNRFKEYSLTVNDTCKASTRRWLADETRARRTVGKDLSFLRRYWTWLQNHGYANDDLTPFTIDIPPDLEKQLLRLPLTDNDVARLFEATKVDPPVHAAAVLAMYTGARIGEIMALTADDVVLEDGVLCFNIKDSKTAAGVRFVPVHSQLIDTLNTTGWLVDGVPTNRSVRHRAGVVGKHFSTIKVELGLPPEKVLHSYRKSFITKLEKGGVSEGVAADIVGHRKKTMTYGLYSGGTSMGQRQKAVELVSY